MCAGNYKEGDTVDRGRYWYVCQDGQLVPRGCFSNDYRRLQVHEAYHSDGYAIACAFDENGYLGFAYHACVLNEREYLPGQTWEEQGKFWYSCLQEGDALRLEMSGCLHDGHRFKIGDTLERDGFVHECRRYANDTCHMSPVGCVHERRRYKIGESFENGPYWYACTLEEGVPLKKCVGCMYAQKRLQDGDRYRNNDAVFECTIRRGDEPDHRLVGCMDEDQGSIVERRLGCQWVKGTAPYQYMMQCVPNETTGGVLKKAITCFYRIGNGALDIRPGCFKTDGQALLIGCHRDSADGALTLKTYPITMLKDAYSKGLRYC